jgi:hypothetical protein
MQPPCRRIELKRRAPRLLAVVDPQERLCSTQHSAAAELLDPKSHDVGKLHPG